MGPLGAAGLALAVLLLVLERGWAEDPAEPQRGSFLVASRELVDPNFRQSVVLILEYGEDGSVGLVVNRQSRVPLSTLVPYITELRGRPDKVYLGGPVEPLRMTFLFRSPRSQEDALQVLDGVWASSSFDLLESTLKQAGAAVRVFAGYAGWAPAQLEAEIGRGDWHVILGDPEAVFSLDPDELWRELIQRVELRVVGF
jgi:putative transcriptional regulator